MIGYFKKNKSVIIFIFITILILLLAGYDVLRNTTIKTLSKSPEISDLYIGNSKLVAVPIESIENSLIIPVGGVISIELSSPQDIGGFSLYSPGNLHETSTYAIKSADIYFVNESGNPTFIKSINNKGNNFKADFDRNIRTANIQILVTDAWYDNITTANNLEFYQYKETNLSTIIASHFKTFQKSFFGYLFYTILFTIILFLPGYIIVSIFEKFINSKLSSNLKVISSPLITVVLFSLISIIFIYTQFDLILYLPIFVVLISLSLLIIFNPKTDLVRSKEAIAIFALVLFITNSIQYFRDISFNLPYLEIYLDQLQFIPKNYGYLGYHSDNMGPWGIARSLLNKAPWFSVEADLYRIEFDGFNSLDRTPILALLTITFLELFGESHFHYQRLLNISVGLQYAAMFIVVWRYFGKKAAILASLLYIISAQLTFQIFNTEFHIKLFAGYSTLISILILKTQIKGYLKPLVSGILLAIGYFIHPITILYAFQPMVITLLDKVTIPRRLINTGILLTPLFLSMLFWYTFTYHLKQKHKDNNPEKATEALYLNQISNINKDIILNKGLTIINIFIPDIQTRKTDYDSLFTYQYMRQELIRRSIFFNVGPVFVILAIMAILDKAIRQKFLEPILLIFAPFFSFLLLFHTYSFGVYILIYPVAIPLIYAAATQKFRNLHKDTKVIILSIHITLSFIFLYLTSGLFADIRYHTLINRLALWTPLIAFCLVSYLLFKYGLEYNDEKSDQPTSIP